MVDLRALLGVERQRVSHGERLLSGLGAFLGILVVVVVSRWAVDGSGAYLVVASMGASAVLLFAVPHGPLSQPWPVLAGHLVSALIGVACARHVPHPVLAASLAVGLAVTAMYYLRCIHPPGGATALTAVLGGPAIADLGYGYILMPVALNAGVLAGVALAYNAVFPWRRYPAALGRRRRPPARVQAPIAHEDFVYALSQMDSFIDVDERDLMTLYDLATRNREAQGLGPEDLRLGACYSNGAFGADWAVRQIIDWEEGQDPREGTLVYRGVAGPGRRRTGSMSREAFLAWARYEVYRDEENWRRVDGAAPNGPRDGHD